MDLSLVLLYTMNMYHMIQPGAVNIESVLRLYFSLILTSSVGSEIEATVSPRRVWTF